MRLEKLLQTRFSRRDLMIKAGLATTAIVGLEAASIIVPIPRIGPENALAQNPWGANTYPDQPYGGLMYDPNNHCTQAVLSAADQWITAMNSSQYDLNAKLRAMQGYINANYWYDYQYDPNVRPGRIGWMPSQGVNQYYDSGKAFNPSNVWAQPLIRSQYWYNYWLNNANGSADAAGQLAQWDYQRQNALDNYTQWQRAQWQQPTR